MHRTAYALLLMTALLWAGNAVAGKLAVGHVSPMLLTCMRWLVAVAVLLPIALPKLVLDWRIVRRNWLLLAGLGACGFTLFNAIFYVALSHTTAINVAIEQAGMPVLIILGNFLVFRARVTPAQMIGVALTIAGVLLTATHGDPRLLLALDVNYGDAIMLVAVMLYSAYSVGLRVKPALHWQTLILALSLAALATSLPFVAWEAAAGDIQLPDAQGWMVIAYAGIAASVISQVAFIRGIELIGGNRASIFINMVPIFGVLLSIAIVGESFHLYHGVAMALVFGGIWLAEHNARRDEAAAKAAAGAA